MRPGLMQLARCGCLLAAMGVVATDTRAQNPYHAPPVGVTFVVQPQVRLSVSTGTVDFSSADPEEHPSVDASGPPLTVRAKVRLTDAPAFLTVRALTDLVSTEGATIPATVLSWRVNSGTGYQAGTVRLSDETMGLWAQSGDYSGSVTFVLNNQWTYATGFYQTTIQFTLCAP